MTDDNLKFIEEMKEYQKQFNDFYSGGSREVFNEFLNKYGWELTERSEKTVKYVVLDEESPDYLKIGRLYSVNTFIDTGIVFYTLEFEGRKYGSYDFRALGTANINS